ncbi:hypothetical protein H096_14143 [Pseudomonas sp. FH1]|nr:hypothetical protein H096_14143 [Pseudomonas sp. FH1]
MFACSDAAAAWAVDVNERPPLTLISAPSRIRRVDTRRRDGLFTVELCKTDFGRQDVESVGGLPQEILIWGAQYFFKSVAV